MFSQDSCMNITFFVILGLLIYVVYNNNNSEIN